MRVKQNIRIEGQARVYKITSEGSIPTLVRVKQQVRHDLKLRAE